MMDVSSVRVFFNSSVPRVMREISSRSASAARTGDTVSEIAMRRLSLVTRTVSK
jgi:hypothetical protein